MALQTEDLGREIGEGFEVLAERRAPRSGAARFSSDKYP